MKIGFIGCGNMGGAMMRGILEAGKCEPQDMMASALRDSTLERRRAELGVRTTKENREAAAFADMLFLAVKPQYYQEVIEEIRDSVRPDRVDRSGKDTRMASGTVWRRHKDRARDAEYTRDGGRGHDRSLPELKCHGRRTADAAGNLCGIRPHGGRARTPDGCCDLGQRQFPRLCIYVH